MKTYYLITVNSTGNVSYKASGSYYAMRKRSCEPWHRVTSISHPDKAAARYGTEA